ncbi:hypothetical protein ABT215_41375 [Streptomyces sp900105755]|uniref:hypothetical protein n=1 Tax=Streptomyces sp. 900105755 TaxID=3154389 RepID=UPI003333C04C
MRIARIVRQTPVKHGDEWALVVSTVQVGFRAYETTIFDDTPDKRLEGWKLGDVVIETSREKASTREEAMEQHREALYAARTETPKPPATDEQPRFTVQQLGPRDFYVYDSVTCLSYDPRFTRAGAQVAANYRNAASKP